jgi:RimJ/RimL family protein N-acetyltransferase
METAVQLETASDVLVFPYVEGQNIFPDEFLVALWRRTKDEGLLPWCFPGLGDISLEEFIVQVRNRWLVVASSRSLNKFLGYGWLFEVLGQPGYRKASLGFGFWKEFWGKEIIREAARKAVSWWFDNVQLQVLYGAMRHDNEPAIRFSRELGFRQIGTAPLFFSGAAGSFDAHLVCITKDEWEASLGRTQPADSTSPASP